MVCLRYTIVNTLRKGYNKDDDDDDDDDDNDNNNNNNNNNTNYILIRFVILYFAMSIYYITGDFFPWYPRQNHVP